MLSNIVKISMPIILVGIIFLIGYNTYEKTQKKTHSPIEVIPTNAALILQFNDVENLSRSLRKSTIWSKLRNINIIDSANTQAEALNNFFTKNQKFFKSNKLFISLHKVNRNSSALLMSTNYNLNKIKNFEKFIKQFSKDFQKLSYDNQFMYYSQSLNKYISFKDEILFFSKSKMLIEDAIRTSKEDSDNLFINTLFSNCYKTINKSADINLILNYNNLISLCNIFLLDKINDSNFSEWTATDLKIRDNILLASGISNYSQTIDNFIDIFNSQKANELNVLNIIPDNTTQLFAISFSNQKDIYKKKNQLLQKRNKFWNWDKNRKLLESNINFSYSDFISEIDSEAGIFNTSTNLESKSSYTFFKAKEAVQATSILQDLIISSTEYKSYTINKIIDEALVANLFGDVFNSNNSFFTVLNEYFIFGNSTESLEYIIDKYISKNTISKNESFKKLNSYISRESNVFFYMNFGKTLESLKNKLSYPKSLIFNSDSISKFTGVSLQMSNSSNGTLHNLSVFYDKDYKPSIKEKWYFHSDTSISMKPNFVNNHFTSKKMILVQDDSNKLIALNSSGEIVWDKIIDSRILGNIQYIDFYKNNKFQALFNTYNKLYLIDRNGEIVNGFPKNLPFKTSKGLTLFDYNNDKKYRIIIIGENNILYNLNKNGVKVPGWKYTETDKPIKQTPIHFKVKENDYILKSTNSTIKLLALNGSERIVFSDIKAFKNNIKITENGELYYITNDQKLWKANVSGRIEIIEMPNISVDSRILSYKEGYYISNQNTLSYVQPNNKNQIDFTLESTINNITSFKDYIVVFTNEKLYLLKENNIMDGFPIDSDGFFNISDINNNGKINIVNLRNNFIYNYELID